MIGVYKLQNEIMHYDWGSAEYLPELLGFENPDRKPYAEVWMGTHPRGPSFAVLDEGENPLSSFSGSLPFLLKLLAAEKPLSIQAHPDKAHAEAGYARENALHVPLDAPERGYKDQNHKPEILCALTPFRALCGFRKTDDIKRRLSVFSCQAAKKLRESFDSNGGLRESGASRGSGGLKNFLRVLLELTDHERDEISSFIKKNMSRAKSEHEGYRAELELVEKLDSMFPRDPSVLSPLYLNLVCLNRGEAIFVPPGVIHSYIHGAGVELMAASDNVIRCGLTSKYIDRAELFAVLKFSPFMPVILKPETGGPYKYRVPVSDFSLVRMDNAGAEAAFPVSSDAILVCVNGNAGVCSRDGGKIELGPGESAFIAGYACENIYLSGSFEVYIASGSTRYAR
ncbi:MAG: mannose-6-phosphate isomerase, class I [Spirochaetaceae bacterium]|jgi:mannose-6-phosphate isomerase|nr:mannose-6-phosphate isomerase, class I [Spirochaetaceae bacterium]